ncbi:MAG: RHS repeat-associated core domain-containing protein [Armatimonadota bacterium]
MLTTIASLNLVIEEFRHFSPEVTSILTTEAFGNTVSQWGSRSNPYRFAGLWGYRDDGDAGLLHVGARYYDPQVGRFISRDAVLSEHPYLYCEHEPVKRWIRVGTV